MDSADYIALMGFFVLSGGVFLVCDWPGVAIVDGSILLIAGLVMGFVRGARKNGDSR